MFQIQWIWHNLKGYRKFYVTALVLSIVCNALYLTTPYFSKELVDKFLSSKDALLILSMKESCSGCCLQAWWALP